MVICKFLGKNIECLVANDFSFPTGVSMMGYCMVAITDECHKCNWFTEVE